jgi:hypothetical protein
MSDNEWLAETESPQNAAVVAIDRRSLSERSKLSDRGVMDFRRVCDQLGILDRETDTIRLAGKQKCLTGCPNQMTMN